MKRTIFTAVFLALCFSTAYGDQLVLSGSLTGRSQPGPGLSFSFAGPDFSAVGGAAGSNSGIIVLAQNASPYMQGAPVNMGLVTLSGLSWNENLNGSMIVNGVTYSLHGGDILHPNASAAFTFTSMTTIPFTSEASIIVTAPFTMTGLLSSRDNSGIFLLLTGQGIASITLNRTSQGSYAFDGTQGVRYGFTTPAPEPATLLLLATGLAGVGGAIRKMRGPR